MGSTARYIRTKNGRVCLAIVQDLGVGVGLGVSDGVSHGYLMDWNESR